MSDSISNEHLSPEVFVDLLDGAPVDAAHRQHLSSCVPCRRELTEIRETLTRIESARDSEARPVQTRRFGRYALWVSAAAVLFLVLVFEPDTPSHVAAPGAVEESAEVEALLPPIDEDEEFRVLLVLSQDAEDSEAILESVQFVAPLSLDPSELSVDERRSLLEGLARALRSRS